MPIKSRPTYGTLEPVQIGQFNRSNHRDSIRRNRWNPTNPITPDAFNARDLVAPTAVAAIRKAFLLAKTGHRGWKAIQREGRFDVRQAPRITRGAQDVFKRKVGRSTTRVKVSVMIDTSGSMHTADAHITLPGTDVKLQVPRQQAAAVFGATIATALGGVPTVDLDIYQHAAANGKMQIKYRWAKGTPVAVFNESAYHGLGEGGNADGHAMFAITERMKREVKRDEVGIIMVVSDGLPSQYAQNGTVPGLERLPGEKDYVHAARSMDYQAGQALIDAVAHARRAGFEVIAVAIDGSDQSTYYGPKAVIPFKDGDWTALGSALARHIGAALASR